MTLPAAIAGPYAKRCAAVAARISCLAPLGAAISRPVPASVAESRRRLSATATASTPPARALNRKALNTSAGPMMAPIAPISLTSPAPVAPSRWPGSINAIPMSNPMTEPQTERPLIPKAANPIPTLAIVAVSTFGIRLVRTSMTVAIRHPAATAAKATLDTCGDRRPENCLNGVPHGGHRAERDDRDEGHQQAVLEQVLAVFRTAEAAGCGKLHEGGDSNG